MLKLQVCSGLSCSESLYISMGDWLPGIFFFSSGIRIPCSLFIGSWMRVLPFFREYCLHWYMEMSEKQQDQV